DLQINNGVMDGSVDDSGKIHVEPLWQVKAWISRKKEVVEARHWIREMGEEFAKISPRTDPVEYESHKDGHLLEVSIFDLHAGKLAWNLETGHDNWDLQIAQSFFKKGVEALISRSSTYSLNKILFVCGNDF